MFLASCGWLWLVVGGFGSLWVVFGSLWLVLYFITNDLQVDEQ